MRIRLEPQPAYLDPWKGKWVAVKDDEVIGCAESSYELGRMLIDSGLDGPDVATRYVPKDELDGWLPGGFEVVG